MRYILGMKELIDALNNDEVITLKTNKERCELYDYMEINDIDPDNYRTNGPDIWLA